MNLLGTDIKLEAVYDSYYSKCITAVYTKEDGSKTKIVSGVSFGNSIGTVDKEVKVYDYGLYATRMWISNYMNANEFLFRHLRLPLNIILNSMNTVVDPYKLPNEGISKVPVDDKLCERVLAIRKSDGYKRFRNK